VRSRIRFCLNTILKIAVTKITSRKANIKCPQEFAATMKIIVRHLIFCKPLQHSDKVKLQIEKRYVTSNVTHGTIGAPQGGGLPRDLNHVSISSAVAWSSLSSSLP
jgi:hypothetical protein